jgi:AraC-like DNA-binding protein
VERGTANARLAEVQRIFDVLGLRLELAARPRPEEEDPDLLPEWTEEHRDQVVAMYGFYLRRVFNDVTHVLAGRLAALVQGAPVHVHRLDLAVAESELEAVDDDVADLMRRVRSRPAS